MVKVVLVETAVLAVKAVRDEILTKSETHYLDILVDKLVGAVPILIV